MGCGCNGSRQMELFKAETTWFHVFRDMIESGDVAKMGSYAATVYLVIKAHTNFSTGRSFPEIETIAEKSGVSIAQVKRELKVLEGMGYISKTRKGRSNVYTLREKVSITGGDGRPEAVATWDYLPSSVQHAVADLKNVLITGELAGAKIVHIERLQVNVQNNYEGGNIQFNEADLAKLPKDMQETLERMRSRRNREV
ncbi:MAG: helix-turn-helix domain-containing protein [Burkholderiales bacterium]|nr:helix-turn-helix domain-containing protein [Burkholderiales bacterium]